MRLLVTMLAIALVAAICLAPAHAATIIDDFSGGVATESGHPNPADGGTNAFGVWYDITNDTFGTPSAGTLNGSPAMRIVDGGFTNGVYAIFQAVVPTTGVYTASADILVNDTATSDLTNYQVGVIVNGVHRGPNPSDVATFTGAGTAVGNYTGLTADVLDVTTTQNVVTGQFNATAGDNVLIGFGTSLDVVNFDSNSGLWNGATVDVDNVMLNLIPEPSAFALASLGLLGVVASSRRRAA